MTHPTLSPSSHVSIASSVYVRPFGDELVVLDFARGEYFGLDETGAAVWRALSEGKSVAEAALALTERFEVDRETAERDVMALVGALSDASLIVLSER